MKQSEIISRLICLAFVERDSPIPLLDDGRTILRWEEAMGAYAEAVLREAEANPSAAAAAAPLAGEPGEAAESEDPEKTAAELPDTHTHTHTQRGGPRPPRLTAEA